MRGWIGGSEGILTSLEIGTINFYTCSYITFYFLVLTKNGSIILLLIAEQAPIHQAINISIFYYL